MDGAQPRKPERSTQHTYKMMTDEEFEEFISRDDSSIEWTLLEGTLMDLRERMDKLAIKSRTEAYDRGYKAGANQKDNKPCVCGFWGPVEV